MRGALRVATSVALFAAWLPAQAVQAQPPQQTLQYMVVLSRHGLRTPLWIPEQADQYAAQPWPKWDVPLGNLTARGKTQMQIVGAYDRDYLQQTGLLTQRGCMEASRFYFHSDAMERDIESARALARGMLPNCEVPIHGLPEGQPDPLFKPREAGVGHYDAAIADAELLVRLGGNAKELLKTLRPGVESVEEILLGCKPNATCPAAGSKVKRLPIEPVEEVVSAVKAVDSFLMEYQGALDSKDVGWGRVDTSKLGELRKFKAEADDLGLTSYAARATSSNLLDHLLLSLQQAQSGKGIPGALGQPGDKALFVLGHDTDIQRIARLLNLSWALNGNVPHETPPGCALIFELWGDSSGKQTVRVYFQTATMEQIRNLTPLTLKNPPERMSLTIPACATSGGTWNCFQHAVESAIDPAFVAR
jgi:4-phytase/acid phosphatase